MRRAGSVFSTGMFIGLPVLAAGLACDASARSAGGAVITYVSSTRYIQGNGIPREEAVQFADFSVSRGAFVGFPMSTMTYARVEASQTSRLLSDRIEIAAATLTQFIENPRGSSISAISSASVVFSIDQETLVTLSTGPIFSWSNGGSAGAILLRNNASQDFVLGNSELGVRVSALLAPGEYRFLVFAASDSRQSVAGPAQAVATLTVPSPGAAALLAAGGFAALRRRRDRVVIA